MDERATRSLIAYCRAAYPHYQIGDDTVRVYVDGLADCNLSESEVFEAGRRWTKRHDRFPTVADLRETFREVSSERPAQPRAETSAGDWEPASRDEAAAFLEKMRQRWPSRRHHAGP